MNNNYKKRPREDQNSSMRTVEKKLQKTTKNERKKLNEKKRKMSSKPTFIKHIQ